MKAHKWGSKDRQWAATDRHWIPFENQVENSKDTSLIAKGFNLYYERFLMFKGNMPFNSDYFYKNKCKITNETSQFLLQQHKTLTKKKKVF